MLCPSQSFLLCFHQRWESHLIGRYILHVKSKYENNIIIIKMTAWPLARSCAPWFGWCCSLWSAHRLSPTPAEVQIRGNNSVGAQWGSSVWSVQQIQCLRITFYTHAQLSVCKHYLFLSVSSAAFLNPVTNMLLLFVSFSVYMQQINMWCTDQSTAAFPMCLQKTLALLLHWRKRCCCILMYYIESIFACIIMTLNGHIFISWEAQSSWKCAGCFSCSFFPPRVLETFWGRVFLLPHLLPDVCQVVRRPQSLPPLQRRFLALPCCCWLPVSGEAAKTTNKTHQQTDTVMFVWLQPRLWHSHKNKVALFIMRMMMVTSVNICRDSRTKQRTHKDSDVTLDKCNDEMMKWWNDEWNWKMCDDSGQKRNTRVNEVSKHAGPPAAAPRVASGTSSSSLKHLLVYFPVWSFLLNQVVFLQTQTQKTWSRSESSRRLWLCS